MEAVMRMVMGLSGRAFDELDRVWLRVTEGFFSLFLVILVGTPVLARIGWSFVIFLMMVLFFVTWLSVTFRLRNLIAVGGGSLLYGVPAEGNSSEYAKAALRMAAKAVFVILIWGEIWMAIYFHFPSFAKDWWMVGSAASVMLVVIPVVIYAISTGKMLEGPWHKPVLAVAIALLVVIMVSAIPQKVWTSVGINPIALSVPETSERAQEIRKKSFDNLVEKKLGEMQTLKQKVDRGDVLKPEELKRLEALEQETKQSVPSVPEPGFVSVVKQEIPATVEEVSPKHVLLGILLAVLLWWVVRRTRVSAPTTSEKKDVGAKQKFPWWILILAIAGYFTYTSETLRGWWNESNTPAVTDPRAVTLVPRAGFIRSEEWGMIGARQIPREGGIAGTIAPIFPLEKGQYNGKRPVPILGMNGGNNITLIIEPDANDESKDIIIAQQSPCNETFGDGSWGCATNWYTRNDGGAKGVAYLSTNDQGVRMIDLADESDNFQVQFQIEYLKK